MRHDRRAAGLAGLAVAATLLHGCDRAERPRTPAASASAGVPTSLAPVIRRVSPAVVSIDTVGGAAAAGGGARLAPDVLRVGAASGFLITADGFIVTNNHVVANARAIGVTLADGRRFQARLVGRDPPTDLAVLKIEARGLPYARFAPAAQPEVGDWVIAVGNPYGLGGTATAGIVSAREREVGEPYVRFLQIDAPMNVGNSGGPSFDLQGRVVGVNTAIFTTSGASAGIGFAIPASLADSITSQLMRSGRVIRGYLGVMVREPGPATPQPGAPRPAGAQVASVDSRGPAAGRLQPGDVVTALNGRPVATPADLTRSIGTTAPGARVTLRILRNGRAQDVSLVVGTAPAVGAAGDS